jgi:hypothetical protein
MNLGSGISGFVRISRLDPLLSGYCCKTILGARAGNIDSITATNAQHRFKTSFRQASIIARGPLLVEFCNGIEWIPETSVKAVPVR